MAEKNPFKEIPLEWRDALLTMNVEEIKSRIAQVALDQEELRKAQEDDGDLFEKKAALKYAMEPYREGKKLNRLKIQYARQILSDKGAL